MGTMMMNIAQPQMWRLSGDHRTVRLQLPPLKLAGVQRPLDVHLDFEDATVDEILQRLTELRTQMEAPPVRQ